MSIDYEGLTKAESGLVRQLVAGYDFGDSCYTPKCGHNGYALLDGYFSLEDLRLILQVEEALAQNSLLGG